MKKVILKICLTITFLLVPLLLSNVIVTNGYDVNGIKKNQLYDYEDPVLDDLFDKWKSKEINNPLMFGSKTIDDFKNASFGIQTGNTLDIAIKTNFPNGNAKYYNQYSDIIIDLKRKVVDATGTELSTYTDMFRLNNNIKIIDQSILDEWMGIPVSKKFVESDGGLFLSQINDFINESKINGFIEQLDDKWLRNCNEKKEYENIVVENPTRILNVAFDNFVPYSYITDEGYKGYDVELLETFCKQYNYGLTYETSDLLSALSGLESGKYDLSIGGFAITNERKHNVEFTIPYHKDIMVLLYYENEKNISFIDSIKSSFYRTFIKENRYKLFLSGLINTLIITIFSVIIGTIVGLLLYLLYRKGNIWVSKILNIYIYIIRGLPFLVLLLILYYVIFGNTSLSSIIIAILSFVIVFSIFVYELFVSTISAIDKGQLEASYALGFTDNETFWNILMPQSIIQMFPSYKSQIISLLKDTSIVGYITVFDLTRAGDIVRSRTYEALFPILSISIIYFMLGAIFALILTLIEKRINPYNRKTSDIERILKK